MTWITPAWSFYGHMFYFVQRAEEAYFRAKGLPVSELVERRNVGFPRVYVACSYRRPARFQDVLQVHVGIGELNRLGFQLLFKVLKKEDRTLLASGKCEPRAPIFVSSSARTSRRRSTKPWRRWPARRSGTSPPCRLDMPYALHRLPF